MPTPIELVQQLEACPIGRNGWQQWENVCIEVLKYTFVPPLENPLTTTETVQGEQRTRLSFPNRNKTLDNSWGHLLQELSARLILCEFKNFSEGEDASREEIDSARLFLKHPRGKLALWCCRRDPGTLATTRRDLAYNSDGQVILFLLPEHLKELVFIKERGDDPGLLVIDLLERYYMQVN